MSLQYSNLTSDTPAPTEFQPPGTPDIEIARSVQPQSLLLLAQQRFGLPSQSLVPLGPYKAQLAMPPVYTSYSSPLGRRHLVAAPHTTPAQSKNNTDPSALQMRGEKKRRGNNKNTPRHQPSPKTQTKNTPTQKK